MCAIAQNRNIILLNFTIVGTDGFAPCYVSTRGKRCCYARLLCLLYFLPAFSFSVIRK